MFNSWTYDIAAQGSTMHDRGLSKLYEKMGKKETDFTKQNAANAAILFQENERIQLLIKNLEVTQIESLLPAFKQYIDISRSIIDFIDPIGGVFIPFNASKTSGISLFRTNKKKIFTRKKINQIYNNVRLFFRADNYMPEADRAILMYDAIMKINYYVLKFAVDSFEEFKAEKETITDDVFLE